MIHEVGVMSVNSSLNQKSFTVLQKNKTINETVSFNLTTSYAYLHKCHIFSLEKRCVLLTETKVIVKTQLLTVNLIRSDGSNSFSIGDHYSIMG